MKCKYGDLKDGLIRDRLVLGVTNVETRKKLLSTPDLTLESAIVICRSEETARRTLRDIQSTADGVHGVRAKLQMKQWKPAEKKAHGQEMKAMTKPTGKYCGQTHAQGRKACPAYGQECRKCKKKPFRKGVSF